MATVATAVLSAALTFATVSPAGAQVSSAAAADECTPAELTGIYAQITGGRVAARISPRSNAEILRINRTGTELSTCGLSPIRGAYANKCGFRGNRWFQVRIPSTESRDGRFLTTAYIPQTCARVVR
jgi:hypothetical protein